MNRWRVWAPMLVAPVLALAGQSIAYALVTPLCSRQAGAWLHAVFALLVLATLALALSAWGESRRLAQGRRGSAPPEGEARGPNRLFLARVATWAAALSVLAVVAMWIPPWMLSPCAS